jgi:hypothetical protein
VTKVRLTVAPDLLARVFALGGERQVVDGFWMRDHFGRTAWPQGWLVLVVDAPDAPEGTTDMQPTWRRGDDGELEMVDPGWRP